MTNDTYKALPFRFKRSRRKGWRKPPNGICCDKSSRWGNHRFDWRVLGRPEAVRLFEEALLKGELDFSVDDVQRELRNRPLGCYCPLDQPCHVDVLSRIANSNGAA